MIIPCAPKTVSWLQISPFDLLGKEMVCKWLVDVLKQPKKKQQDKAYLLTLW
jgi:hypothetical protein